VESEGTGRKEKGGKERDLPDQCGIASYTPELYVFCVVSVLNVPLNDVYFNYNCN